MKKSAGFTLIEIIITIVIVGILAGIAALIILQGTRSYTEGQVRSNVHYQARYAMERMAREVRLIRACGDIAGPANPAASLTFTDIDGNAVTFGAGGTDLLRNADILARGVTALQFRFFDQNGNLAALAPPCTVPTAPTDIWTVEVSMTVAEGAETIQMGTRVHPRNF